jgi:beta-lactamase superfamily II metal-dependent hydrolase
MRSMVAVLLAAGLALATSSTAQVVAKTLQIYYIDTEGGQATLFVSPSGESLLVDTGNPGGRDTDRIMLALADAGVKQIDHLILTHYHVDHIGGLQQLVNRVPVKHFYDHGPTVEVQREQVNGFQSAYAEIYGKAAHTVLKPGDQVPFAGVDWRIVVSAEQPIKNALPGAGKPDPACTTFKRQNVPGPDDNAQSVGSLITFGRFKTIDLGDLLWDNEFDLMCPNSKVGTVDLYLTSHHGLARSGSEALVHGLQPRVALMNNGPRKGGATQALAILHSSPGLEDLWQLHWSYEAGVEQNTPGVFIANLDNNETIANVLTAPPPAAAGATVAPAVMAPGGQGRGGFGGGRGNPAAVHTAYWIKVTAQQDGTFTVTNARNGFTKTYKSR